MKRMSNLFPSIAKEDPVEEMLNQKVSGSLFNTIEYEISNIVKKIENIDDFSVDEIKNIILRQHSMILDYDLFLMSSETRSCAQKLFRNKRFLKILLDVIGLIELPPNEITCINKLAYDYYILPVNEKDKETSDLLFQLSNIINYRKAIQLSSIIGIKGGQILAIISDSSFKQEKNVHRVNTFIIKCNIALSTQDVINIFLILYAKIGFSKPFIYTMLESKPNNLTDDQLQRFDLISIAILDILNSMQADEIKSILMDYAFTLKMVKKDITVRFSIKSAKRYIRLLKIVDDVENDDFAGVKVP